MYREDYRRGGIVFLPVVEPDGRSTARQMLVGVLMLVPASLLPAYLSMAGRLYGIGALALGRGFVNGRPGARRATNLGGLPAAAVWLDASGLDPDEHVGALPAMGLHPAQGEYDGGRGQLDAQDPAGGNGADLPIAAPDRERRPDGVHRVPANRLRRSIEDPAVAQRTAQLDVLGVRLAAPLRHIGGDQKGGDLDRQGKRGIAGILRPAILLAAVRRTGPAATEPSAPIVNLLESSLSAPRSDITSMTGPSSSGRSGS